MPFKIRVKTNAIAKWNQLPWNDYHKFDSPFLYWLKRKILLWILQSTAQVRRNSAIKTAKRIPERQSPLFTPFLRRKMRLFLKFNKTEARLVFLLPILNICSLKKSLKEKNFTEYKAQLLWFMFVELNQTLWNLLFHFHYTTQHYIINIISFKNFH